MPKPDKYFFQTSDDPNDLSCDDDEEARPKPELHTKFSVQELQQKLKREPEKYFRCEVERKEFYCGTALVLDKGSHYQKKINLATAVSCGRTFDGDTVVVELLSKEDSVYMDGFIGNGNVIGVLKRFKEDIYEERFICRVDDNRSNLLIPLDDSSVKIFVVTPFLQFKENIIFIYQRKPGKNGGFEIKKKSTVKLTVKRQESHRILPQLFSVRYIHWSKYQRHPKGYVESSFPGDSLKRYSIQFRIPGKHKQGLIKKSKELIENKDKKLRRQKFWKNLTNLFVFTIDSENARILDDGLSIEACNEIGHEDCWKVGIHIADAGSFIDPETDLDEEARKRMLSFEGLKSDEIGDFEKTDGKMFPSEVTDRFSLVENKERFVVSTFFHSKRPPTNICTSGFDQENFETAPILAKIIVKRRLNYKEAQELISEKMEERFDEATETNLNQQLYQLWRVMWQFRINRLDDAAYSFENLGDYGNKIPLDECFSRILIEEAMISYNASVARYMKQHEVFCLNRTQILPSKEKMEFSSLVKLSPYQSSFHKFYESIIGVNSEVPNEQDDFDSKMRMRISENVWVEIKEKLSNGLTEQAVLLACLDYNHPELGASLSRFFHVQNPACWKSNEGDFGSLLHFNLRLSCYTNCTSPLRKYIDLYTQRKLIRFIHEENYPGPDSNYLKTFCSLLDDENVVAHANKTLKRENDIIKLQKSMRMFERFKDNSTKQCTEGFIAELSELQVHLMFADFHVIRYLKVPLHELGLTLREKECQIVWILRFYNLLTQEMVDQCSRSDGVNFNLGIYLRNRKTISVEMWEKFLEDLSPNCFDRQSSLEQCKNSLDKVYQSIATLEEDWSLRVANNALYTSNKIFHGRKIAVKVSQNLFQDERKSQTASSSDFLTSIVIQFGMGIEQGVQKVVPELALLSSSLNQIDTGMEICMLHRRHVTMFDVNCKKTTLKEKDFDNGTCEEKFLMFLYYEKWMPIVLEEGLFSSIKNNHSFVLQLNDVKLVGSEGTFTLSKSFCENCFVSIRTGDFICLRKRNVTGDDLTVSVFHGVVFQVIENGTSEPLRNDYKFLIFKSIHNPSIVLHKQDLIACEVIPLSVSHRRMVKALNSLTEASPLVEAICVRARQNVLFSTSSPLQCKETLKKKILFVPSSCLERFPHPLNEIQRDQVERALRQQLTLIQGPPGTGKSYMGAHLAYYFARKNLLLKSKGKVLYCGPSNKSVDVVAEYLKKTSDIKFIRVYGGMYEEHSFPIPLKPKRHKIEVRGVPSTLREVALHFVIRKKSGKFSSKILKYDEKFRAEPCTATIADYKKYKELILEAKIDALKDVQIVLCTCTLAGGKLLSEFEFSQCIIDESGMCSEPETLIPIIATTKKTRDPQITLIGDHMQLQPVILCHAAARQGLKKSLFERLNFLSCKLTRQYRMDDVICNFPSQYFYENELVTDGSVLGRSKSVLYHPWNKPRNVALFCNVVGVDQEDELKSRFNHAEVRVVIKVLRHLLHHHEINASQIMVLSPYLAQCKKLRKAINEDNCKPDVSGPIPYSQAISIHVGSVVTSQGSESDYVIVSTVRSSDSSVSPEADQYWLYKHIGFLTDDHQINVAITRARLSLFIVGNLEFLSHYPTWQSLKEEYEGRNAILDEGKLDDLINGAS